MSVLVARKAPDFTAPAVLASGEIVSEFNFYKETQGHYSVLFFYPLDFTFVCPSELLALDHRHKDFESRHVKVLAVSIDSHFTHNAWRNTPVNKGGIGAVHYPMIADMNHSICQNYGVEHPSVGVALRGAFIMDKDHIVRAQIVNDLPLGREIDEMLRVIDALQHNEKHGEVCPAGWKKGSKAMKASPTGVAEYLAEHAEGL